MLNTVMIVDDAIFMRTLLRDILAKAGYNVVAEASNGVEAVKLYEEHKPSLVTMDITMPEKSGMEALKEILLKDPAAQVIMCSAMGQHSLVLDALKTGAKDFVMKPFQPERMLESVHKVLNN